MCGLCSQDKDERELERKRIAFVVEAMAELGRYYDDLLSKNVNPHTDEDKTAKYRARRLIKLLVDDWL